MGWNLLFVTIGVSCAVKWFMGLVDKQERETD